MVKIFEKESWEKVRYLPVKFRGFIDLLRPFTLLAPVIGGLTGALIAKGNIVFDQTSMLTMVYGIATLVMVNGASNALNQVCDAEIDKINKPYRPIPSDVVSKDEARTIAYFLYFFAMFRASMINIQFATMILALVSITILYSMEPIRLKKRLFLSNVSIAIARGLFGFVAAWCIFGDITNITPWFIGLILCIYLLGASTTKDFADVIGDKQYNIRTLPVVYGTKKASFFSAPFFIIPFAIIPFASLLNLINSNAIYLTILILWGIYASYLMLKSPDTQEKRIENTSVWKHMYLLLIALQIGFCVVYLI